MPFAKGGIRRFTLAEYEARLPASKENARHSACEKVYNDLGAGGSLSWFGVKTVGDVREIVEHGREWSGAEKARRDVEEIELPVCRSIRRVRRFGEEGDEARVDVLLSGQMDLAMESRRRDVTLGGSPVFRVWCQICQNACVDADRWLWQAAALLRFCEAVESAGGSVEIVGFHHTSRATTRGKDLCDIVTIKAAGEDISLRRLAIVFGLAGWARVYAFAAELSFGSEISEGMGSSLAEPPKESLEPGDIVLGGVLSRVDAVAWLRNTVKKIEEGNREG